MVKASTSILLLTSILTACSGGGNNQPSTPSGSPFPQSGQWTNFAINYYNNIGNPFSLQNLMGYVYTQPPQLMIGQTITLNYSIIGNSYYQVNDPNDIPPASITLFIWEKNDNLYDPNNAFDLYRWWCPKRAVLQTGDNQVLSCTIDGSWTAVHGQKSSANAQGFNQALSNPLGIGFTFGGAYFYGHGVKGNGNAQFKVNQWTIQ